MTNLFNILHIDNFYTAESNPIGVAMIFDWRGGSNHKSHAMTSSEIFKRETFYGEKIS